MQPPTISYLTNIYFEIGAVGLLDGLLAQHGITKPLIVTDEGLVSLGMLDRLTIEDAAVFSDVQTNPTEANVLAGLEAYREGQCDGLVAFGGGSPIDCAKGIALLATHPEPLEQYAFLEGGLPKVTGDKPPLIAVPTTAGSGSEVGRAALLTMSSGRKLAIISGHMIPSAVISDPELTLGMPPGLTAASGMDAITHCVEVYCSRKINPVADAIALDGLQRGVKNVLTATQNGSDINARSEMLMCALQGGLGFQKGLGLIHSLSHPLGALEDKLLHHGQLNAIFLPHVLEFNMDACPEKMDAMARIMGAETRDELPGACRQLIGDLGLPASLGELGLTEDDVTPLSAAAFADHSTAPNPKDATEADCLALFKAAI
ncbi:MAG: iron-containing alcohol dehydrogenase [Phycisphaerae bacterium]|nr:iron-containing alcohol dehydrogenase [Phycisphaerae bacterium]